MSKKIQTDQPDHYRELIEEQLQKIFRHPQFRESDVLKKFLEFIVVETLEGRSHCLKEYTIAVQALNKPLNFKPQENSIVRIHAGRLRRALNNYYENVDSADEIRIYIPKGNYVPLFGADAREEDDLERTSNHGLDTTTPNEALTVLVLPFDCVDKHAAAFRDGLCMQISSELTHVKNATVVAYQVVKAMAGANQSMANISATLATEFILSGSVQLIANHLRLNIQLIRSKTFEQVWGVVYERKLTPSTNFELQDELAAAVVSEFRKSFVPLPIRVNTRVAAVM
mgnify:CR=1 FL=1